MAPPQQVQYGGPHDGAGAPTLPPPAPHLGGMGRWSSDWTDCGEDPGVFAASYLVAPVVYGGLLARLGMTSTTFSGP